MSGPKQLSASEVADLTGALRELAIRAGRAILDVYEKDFAVDRKADDSPVTAADRAAEDIIVAGLQSLTPGIPVIAEERFAESGGTAPAGGLFWLVDPLDGTREFVKRNGEFTVNIALIERTVPVLGIIHVPAKDWDYWASGSGTAARRLNGGAIEPIAARRPPADGLDALASRSHCSPETENFLDGLPVRSRIAAGSSLKFCLIAAGEGDIYPRLGPTMEWDTAAGHSILVAAGGSVRDLDGHDLAYGKPGFRNPPFVARGAEG